MDKKETELAIVSLYKSKNLSTYELAEKFETYPNKIRRVLKKTRRRAAKQESGPEECSLKWKISPSNEGKKPF